MTDHQGEPSESSSFNPVTAFIAFPERFAEYLLGEYGVCPLLEANGIRLQVIDAAVQGPSRVLESMIKTEVGRRTGNFQFGFRAPKFL